MHQSHTIIYPGGVVFFYPLRGLSTHREIRTCGTTSIFARTSNLNFLLFVPSPFLLAAAWPGFLFHSLFIFLSFIFFVSFLYLFFLYLFFLCLVSFIFFFPLSFFPLSFFPLCAALFAWLQQRVAASSLFIFLSFIFLSFLYFSFFPFYLYFLYLFSSLM